MKRNNFFKAALSTFGLMSLSKDLFGKTARTSREKNGFKVDSGKDRTNSTISLFEGDTFDAKFSTMDTDGDIYVFESRRIEEGGPSHHYHFAQDEWWYVLKGEFLIKVGDTTYELKAGDSVFGQE